MFVRSIQQSVQRLQRRLADPFHHFLAILKQVGSPFPGQLLGQARAVDQLYLVLSIGRDGRRKSDSTHQG